MKLIFIDETSDSKFKNYFGLCCAVINSAFYRQVKQEFQQILTYAGWNLYTEFKGAYLFSETSGCTEISIEQRIEITKKILLLSTPNKNTRIKFFYVKDSSNDQKTDYLRNLPALLNNVLEKPEKKGGKDVVSLHCDFRNDIKISEIRNSVHPIFEKKGYTMFEDIVLSKSNSETIGILYADIVGYLIARVDTISTDSELFDNIPPEHFENNGKIKKLKTSNELIKLIKNIKYVKVPSRINNLYGKAA